MENLDTSNWASKNLDVDHFRNGDVIPEAKTAEDWRIACESKIPAWCYFDNDSSNSSAQKLSKNSVIDFTEFNNFIEFIITKNVSQPQ